MIFFHSYPSNVTLFKYIFFLSIKHSNPLKSDLWRCRTKSIKSRDPRQRDGRATHLPREARGRHLPWGRWCKAEDVVTAGGERARVVFLAEWELRSVRQRYLLPYMNLSDLLLCPDPAHIPPATTPPTPPDGESCPPMGVIPPSLALSISFSNPPSSFCYFSLSSFHSLSFFFSSLFITAFLSFSPLCHATSGN